MIFFKGHITYNNGNIDLISPEAQLKTNLEDNESFILLYENPKINDITD